MLKRFSNGVVSCVVCLAVVAWGTVVGAAEYMLENLVLPELKLEGRLDDGTAVVREGEYGCRPWPRPEKRRSIGKPELRCESRYTVVVRRRRLDGVSDCSDALLAMTVGSFIESCGRCDGPASSLNPKAD